MSPYDSTKDMQLPQIVHDRPKSPGCKVYTIGFTKWRAADFFRILNEAGIRRLVDIRLYNGSQLAGFTKREDLQYFLREICQAEYIHELLLAPTQKLFDAYKKHGASWEVYEEAFFELMAERRVDERLSPSLFDFPTVLLCSEYNADHCHRRLVLEYLRDKWGELEIIHLPHDIITKKAER